MAMTTTANQPNDPNVDMIVRAAPISPKGLDETTRSISCVLSTETPVRMYDWNNGGYIDEVLRADGGQYPDQLPLLDNHSRYSSLDVIGSARDIKPKSGEITGRVYFADKIERANQVYELVRQGHLTDVSVGYRYGKEDYVDIQKGQTATIGGRKYTATDRTMRVVTRWDAKELSVTPIGADKLAKMRSLSDCKFGHDKEVGDNSTQPREENQLSGDRQDSTTMTTKPEEKKTEQTTEQTRTDATPPVATVDLDKVRKEAAEAAQKDVLERIEYARSFETQGVRKEVVDQAIKDNLTKEQMNERFLEALTKRSNPVENKTVAIHITNNERTDTDIQLLFLQRAGINLEGGQFNSECHQATFARYAGHPQDMSWAVRAAAVLERGGKLDEQTERALEFAYQYRNIHLVQLCEMALDLRGITYDRYNQQDIVTRMLTTQSVAPFISNALGAMILEAFVGAEDTTDWVPVAELPNDNPQPVAKGGMASRLKKRLSGQVPEAMTREATEEFISVATFSEQYFTDRKDLLADRFGRIGEGPQLLGEAAREVIQDLVYSCMLLNPTMADGNALFSAAHGNLAVNAPLGPETLAARKTAMANQTNNGRLINCKPGVLLVPESMSHYADELMGSSEKRDTTTNRVYGTKNWAQNKYRVVSESRLDVGCVNPDTGNFVAGRPLDYHLIERSGRYGLMKAFLRANGGGPVVESWTPGDGRIGVGTTVELEAGIKAVAWEGLQRGTGAAS
jgi:hypothetical protein